MIVFHGIRTTQYMLHHLGRETMISPMEWNEKGWPVITKGRIIAPEMYAERIPGDNGNEQEMRQYGRIRQNR